MANVRMSEVPDWTLLVGDCRTMLATLSERSVHTCVTSPPYFGLRDYGTGAWLGGDPGCQHRVREDSRVESSTLDGGKATTGHSREGFRVTCPRCGARRVDAQIGLEPTPDEFVAALVGVFRKVRRVLRDDGTVWLNLGDSYAATLKGTGGVGASGLMCDGRSETGRQSADAANSRAKFVPRRFEVGNGLKPKDLIGIPWMVAFALRADGWYLRSEIIWAKPNPMPESVTDRPTKAHEQIFLLSKQARYYYDADAVREAHEHDRRDSWDRRPDGHDSATGRLAGDSSDARVGNHPSGRNKRSVWMVATHPYPGAHFATFPPKLIEPCILAGCPEGGTVLDPFAGACTTGVVATRNGRAFVGVELSEEYARLGRARMVGVASPLF